MICPICSQPLAACPHTKPERETTMREIFLRSRLRVGQFVSRMTTPGNVGVHVDIPARDEMSRSEVIQRFRRFCAETTAEKAAKGEGPDPLTLLEVTDEGFEEVAVPLE